MNLSRFIPVSLEDQFSDLSQSVKSELQASDRLKWIILGGFIVLYLSFISFLGRQADEEFNEFNRTRDSLARLTQQVSETGWVDRAKSAQDLAGRLEGLFWPGETTGIAEAGFERWIRQNLEKYDTEVRQVLLTRGPAIEDETDFISGQLTSVLKIRAKVIGPLNEAGFINFLHDAGIHSNWIVVEQLIIRDGRNPRYEIDIATFSNTGSADS